MINLKKYHQLYLWIAALSGIPVAVLGILGLLIPQLIMLTIQLVAFVLFLTTRNET